MKFVKMHGLGNDYVYVNGFEEQGNWPQIAQAVSQPHFGISADGLIVILPSQVADFQMRMFNADGSEGAMCGNGIRCVGKYVYDNGLTHKTRLNIETPSGIKSLRLNVVNNQVNTVEVDMGSPKISLPLTVILSDKKTHFHGIPVSMGNPHFVIETKGVETMDIATPGKEIEHMTQYFPDRTNVEFIEVLSDTALRMRVWERGSGETMACGTGASASVVALAATGRIQSQAQVHLNGGILDIRWLRHTDKVLMTGTATTVFKGEINKEAIQRALDMYRQRERS